MATNRPASRPARPVRPAAPPKGPDYRESKAYKFMTSKKTSRVLGILCLLAGLFAVVDYWGPKKTVKETVLGLPGAGNYFLIRTEHSYFAIDPRLQYEAGRLRNSEVDVDYSLTGVPLSFSIPALSATEKFYPVSHRYSYIALQVICLLAGLTLLLYRKTDDTRAFLVVLGFIGLLCGVIPMISIELILKSIYDVKNMSW